MPIIRSSEVKFGPGATPDYKRRVLVGPEKGSGAITLGECLMDPGSSLPLHTHRIEESMVITRGVITAVLGDDTYTLNPGDAILVPASIKHLLANRSQEPAGFLFFYPGVEVQMERM
jgi:quercetin dioxygenase-like cupin family protein